MKTDKGNIVHYFEALKDNSVALTPTVDTLTGVHRYNLGYSFINNQQSGHSDSNFLQLDSTVGMGAHHMALDASLYNLGEPEQSGDIYRAMYERDLDDRRIAAGMVSTWDLQTLGVVTGLSTGRIYGASYGNQAQSRKQKADASTTPVQVFMPANGEVRVYREDRLISLQNLPRRITLDFKDVFSDGFAFDKITGKLAVQKGVMRTERLQIDGTSARVLMFGEVDHHAQRIAPFGGNDHIRVLPLMSIEC